MLTIFRSNDTVSLFRPMDSGRRSEGQKLLAQLPAGIGTSGGEVLATPTGQRVQCSESGAGPRAENGKWISHTVVGQ